MIFPFRMVLFAAMAVATGFSALSARAEPPPPPLQTDKTRREISREKPLFLMMLDMPGEDALVEFWNLMPPDVRPYVAVWTPHTKLYDKINEMGIYFFSETHDPQYAEGDGLEQLYRKYPYMIGNAHGELAPNADFFKKAPKVMARNMRLAEKYGGYVMWRIAAKSRVLPLVAKYWPEFPELARAHADRLILMNRNNGQAQTREGISEIIGAWQTGLIGHWGFDHQSFMWGFESGLNRLFGEETFARYRPMSWLGLYPEAIFGMETLEAAALGATTFTWEYPSHLIYSPDMKRLNPEFRHVILPLLRMMLKERLIADKADVQAQMPVALLQPATAGLRPIRGTANHLYGMKYDDVSEWLPYSGRYLRVPILVDALADEKSKARYQTVVDMVDPDEAARLPWKSELEKVAWFNGKYPAIGRGSAWYVHMADRWYVANHWLNQRVSVDFELPLKRETAASSVSGLLGPHTYATVQEGTGKVRIHLNNYRVDKEALFWDPRFKNADGWFGGKYVEYLNVNAEAPADGTLRETTISLNGLAGEPVVAEIRGGEPGFERPFEHAAVWDAARKTYTLTFRHNGPVDLTVDTGTSQPAGTPANLALFALASASSSAAVHASPDKAIDGNDRSSRWEAQDPRDAWLQLEFREPQRFNRIVLKEYLDRAVDYRLEHWDGKAWLELAQGSAIGVAKEHVFPPVSAAKLRVRFLKTKVDSQNQGTNPALCEIEVYGDEVGIGLPYAPTATDVYEAEEDSILGGGAEKIVAAAQRRLYVFNDGCVRLPEAGKPFARFPVRAAETGLYQVVLRYTRGESFGTGDGHLSIYVNGKFARPMRLPKTTLWTFWSGGAAALVNLEAGWNMLEFRNDAGDAGACMIDHLQVSFMPGVTVEAARDAKEPPRPVVEGQRYQAEDGALGGGAVKLEALPGYSGNGYVALVAKPGQSVSLEIPAEREGYRQAGLRYAVAEGNEAVVTCFVNGTKARRFVLKKQGDYGPKYVITADWNFIVVPLWLAKGGNDVVFKVEAGDSGNALIDSVVVGDGVDEKLVAPTRVGLANAVSVPRGGWQVLVPVVEPATSSVKDFVWESADPSIATVSPHGAVKGLKPGTTTVTVRPVGGGRLSASCEVTVSGELSNIAPQAKLTASTGEPRKAVDQIWQEELGSDFRGVPMDAPGWLYGDIRNDWTTTPGESLLKRKRAWVRLEWKEPRTISRVVLYPPASLDSWGEAAISDSTGGSVEVGPIGVAGEAPIVIPFDPPVSATWIQLDILKQPKFSHAGNAVGEIEVDGR